MGWSLSYLSLQFSPRLGVYRWQLFVPSENLYCKWSYQLFIFLKSPIQPQSSTETWHQLHEILPGKPLQAHSSTMIALYHPPWSPQLTLLQCMLLDAVFLNQNIVTLTPHRKKKKPPASTSLLLSCMLSFYLVLISGCIFTSLSQNAKYFLGLHSSFKTLAHLPTCLANDICNF